MRLSDLDYELPPELIAQEPVEPRDASRLMVVNRARGTVAHHRFHELPRWLSPGDLLVVNDTRVVPARVYGRRQGHTGRVELLFVRSLDRERSLVMARPAKKLSVGTALELGESGIGAEVLEVREDGRRVVRLAGGEDINAFLEREGHVPLPPYVQREDTPEDRVRYQTVFAKAAGAVAAPTAGLHFTPQLLDALRDRGVDRAELTLHVGPGTFVPVTAEDPREHRLEEEAYQVSPAAAEAVNAARESGNRVVAVGTTSVRTLETVAAEAPGTAGGDAAYAARAGSGFTHAFIYPPYSFRLVDALITNFHLPKTSLLLLVAAFAGEDLLHRAYREAVEARYRFYSYGDAMLIL